MERIRGQLREYVKAKHGRESDLARQFGVKQYNLSRFINGQTRKLPRALEPVCRYAGIDLENRITPIGDNPLITAALTEVWDGTEESAQILSALIRSVGPLLLKSHRDPSGPTSGELP